MQRKPSQIYVQLVVMERKNFVQVREETWWRWAESKPRERLDAVALVCSQESPRFARTCQVASVVSDSLQPYGS